MDRPRLLSLVVAFAFAGVAGRTPTARAQVPELVRVSTQYTTGDAVDDRATPKPPVASHDVALNVPVPLASKTFLIPGLAYHSDAVSLDEGMRGGSLGAFHSVSASALFVQVLPSDWLLTLRFAGGLAGDFEAVDGGLVRFNGMALASHRFDEHLRLGAGFLGTYSVGSFLPLPALQVGWQPIESLRIDAFIPAFVDARVTVADRVELGYRAEIQGNQYAIRDATFAESDECVGPADGRTRCFDSLSYSVVSVGPRVALRLASTVWLEAYGGHHVYRRFEPIDPDGDAIPGGAGTLPSASFIRGSVVWRVPTRR